MTFYLTYKIFFIRVLSDEINRAGPKTQAAMLQIMGEGAISLEGVIHPLPDPFFVLATQNPIEQEGTYPLPEAQLDRFMLKIKIGYPEKAEERLILDRMAATSKKFDVQQIFPQI